MNQLEESIYFYTLNDYLLINNLLWGNAKKLEKSIQIIYDDAKASIALAERIGIENRWRGTPERCNAVYNAHRKRTPEILDKKSKAKFILRAKQDIENIYGAMKPSQTDMVLYRNIRLCDVKEDDYGLSKELKQYGFSSCSKRPCESSYNSKDKKFVRFKIIIPKNTLMLDLDNFPDWNNEKGEVVLPPFKAKVCRHFLKQNNPDCLYEVELFLNKTFKPKILLNKHLRNLIKNNQENYEK